MTWYPCTRLGAWEVLRRNEDYRCDFEILLFIRDRLIEAATEELEEEAALEVAQLARRLVVSCDADVGPFETPTPEYDRLLLLPANTLSRALGGCLTSVHGYIVDQLNIPLTPVKNGAPLTYYIRHVVNPALELTGQQVDGLIRRDVQDGVDYRPFKPWWRVSIDFDVRESISKNKKILQTRLEEVREQRDDERPRPGDNSPERDARIIAVVKVYETASPGDLKAALARALGSVKPYKLAREDKQDFEGAVKTFYESPLRHELHLVKRRSDEDDRPDVDRVKLEELFAQCQEYVRPVPGSPDTTRRSRGRRHVGRRGK